MKFTETERSSIDLQMTLRLFINIEPHKLVTGVCWCADSKGIDNFNVKVINRLSIDLQVALGLFTKIQSYNLGPRGLLARLSQRNEKVSCQGHQKVTN